MSPPGRRWLEVSVRCPSAGDRGSLLADALVALGGRATEERGGWYVTYLEDPGDPGAFEARALEALGTTTGLRGIELRLDWQEQEDWAEAWKRGLEVRRVTERIVVRPSWLEHTPATPDEIVIVLDPGMAFGTAEHGTTRGCLRLLDRAVRTGDRVLDVGAGSGILSVAAARLGAAEVVAIEGDPLAVEAIEENVERNGVTDRVRPVTEWADGASLRARGPVDGVVANIEVGILGPLLPGLVEALRPGGWLIVSGILDEEWAGMERALEARGCVPVAVDADGEWRSGLLTRRA